MMEKELILKLALLKKLSLKTPKLSCLNRFMAYQRAKSHHSSPNPKLLNTTRQPFLKYPSQTQLHFLTPKPRSLQPKISARSSRGILDDDVNLTGWNAQNEEENQYSKLIQKKDSFICSQERVNSKKTPQKQVRQQQQKKFTYCEQEIDYFFKEYNILDTKVETKETASRKHRSKKLKPLIIGYQKTEQNKFKHNQLACKGKENLLAEQLELICPSKTPKQNRRTKIQGPGEDLVYK